MKNQDVLQVIGQGIVLLDGATGSNLYRKGMPRGACTEGWILEHPEVMKELQRAYLDAGTQLIYAPTFGANRTALQKHGLDANLTEINERLIALTQEVCTGRSGIYIGGDLSPTGMMLEELGGDDSIDDVFEVYREQAEVIGRCGVDFIAVETMLSQEETEIALDAARSVCDLPIFCTLTVQADGRTFYGSDVVEASISLQELGAAAVGINCSVGPDQLESVVRNLAQAVTIPVIAKPNAGMPVIDEHGQANYLMGPAEYASHMKKLVEAGATLIGGCCGTTPDYIRKLALLRDEIPVVS